MIGGTVAHVEHFTCEACGERKPAVPEHGWGVCKDCAALWSITDIGIHQAKRFMANWREVYAPIALLVSRGFITKRDGLAMLAPLVKHLDERYRRKGKGQQLGPNDWPTYRDAISSVA